MGRTRISVTKPCEICGVTIGPYNPTMLAKYRFCGKACRLTALAAKLKKRTTKPCEDCGKTIGAVSPGRLSKIRFCSRSCAVNARRTISPQSCVVCGKSFTPQRLNGKYPAKYCSRSCYGRTLSGRQHENLKRFADIRAAQMAPIRAAEETERIAKCKAKLLKRAITQSIRTLPRAALCIGCDELLPMQTEGKRLKRVCVRCVASKIRASRKRSKALRRMRISAQSENIDQLLLFARDKWRCHLCGCRTPRKLIGTNDEREPTQDHVVPVSSGGSHTWINLRCCCRRCNVDKRAIALGQLDMGFPVTTVRDKSKYS
jgi:5-methylcytosine-specific restriction endonuclease McrA